MASRQNPGDVSKVFSASRAGDASHLDFHKTDDFSINRSFKKPRDITVDDLSKQELLIDSHYGDDSQQSPFLGDLPPATAETLRSEKKKKPISKKMTKAEKAEHDFFHNDGSQEDPKFREITSEFNMVMANMTMRDHLKEIADAKHYVASRQTNTNEAIQKAKQGHFKLNKKRMIIPAEYLTTTNDTERLNLVMLNDYLNGYTEKLSRGNPKEPSEIKLDQLNFGQVLKGVSKKTYMPNIIALKRQAAFMNKQILQSENPRYMSQHLKAQLNHKEEMEVRAEMERIQQQFQPNYKDQKHKYMKGADINKFANYQAMLTKFTSKSCENQRQVKTQQSCQRPECNRIFAETFNGSQFGGVGTFDTRHFSVQQNSVLMPALNLSQELKNGSTGLSGLQQDSMYEQASVKENNRGVPTSTQRPGKNVFSGIMSPFKDHKSPMSTSGFYPATGSFVTPLQNHQGHLNIQQYNSVLNSLYPNFYNKTQKSTHKSKNLSETCRSTKASDMTDIEQRISEIGSIWSGTSKMKKANKGFERKTVRQLKKINRELRGLGNQVNEEIQVSKKEYDYIKEQVRREKEREQKRKLQEQLAKLEQQNNVDDNEMPPVEVPR